jgi:hypothetical protein
VSNDDPQGIPSARARIDDALMRFQKNWPRVTDPAVAERDRRTSSAWTLLFFHYVVLVETVRQQDEAKADRLVEWLDEMTEDGGMGEQMWEWRSALDGGGQIKLPDLSA